jgi:hypothetical protein
MFATTWENIKKNWETGLPGVISAIAMLVAILYPDSTAFINKVAGAIAAVVFAVGMLLSKSANVTGTALNPRAEIVGEPTPLPTPAAAATIAKIEATK